MTHGLNPEPPKLEVVPNDELAALMQAVLAKGGRFRFQATGSSMRPFIREGDVLTVEPLAGPARLGEVVVCVQADGGRLMVHRVVRVGRTGWLTKGDQARQADGWVEQPGLVGRVVRVERQGQAAWAGLGRERVLIGWLSRWGWLVPMVGWAAALMKKIRRFS